MVGCFSDPFSSTTRGPDETDSGMDAGTEDSGMETDSDTNDSGPDAGSDSSTDTGTDTGTDTDSGTDTGDPCDVVMRPSDVASYFGVPCEGIFGQTACDNDEELTRASMVVPVIMNYVPAEQFMGYTPPAMPHHVDVPEEHFAYDAVERSHWLQLLEDEGNFFLPEDPARVCWTGAYMVGISELPDHYSVVDTTTSDNNVAPEFFWALSIRYNVWGTNPGSHLNQMVSVVNNVAGDFMMGEHEDALAEVQLICRDPEGAGTTEYMAVPVNGVADFDVDCWDESGDGLELEVRIRVAAANMGADPGDQIRVAIDPSTLSLRGGGLEDVPVFTVE